MEGKWVRGTERYNYGESAQGRTSTSVCDGEQSVRANRSTRLQLRTLWNKISSRQPSNHISWTKKSLYLGVEDGRRAIFDQPSLGIQDIHYRCSVAADA